MNFQECAENFLSELENGSNKARPSTLKTYRSLIDCHLKRFSQLKMEAIASQNNRLLRDLVAVLRGTHKPATIRSVVTLFKMIVDSLVDDNGVPTLRCVWNNDFISLPAVVASEQRAPIITAEEVSKVINSQDGLLYATLAVTGMRIGEALALRIRDYDPEAALIYVRAGKTAAAQREIDLPLAFNRQLRAAVSGRDRLFPGSIMAYRQRARGVTGFAHSFRRFRLTHLRMCGMPEDLVMFYMGHASKTITDRYSRIRLNKEFRREWTERCGIGFTL